MIKLKYQSVFNESEDLKKFREIVLEAHNKLHGIPTKNEELNEWTGWLDLPNEIDENKKLVSKIVSTRRRLKKLGVDTLVVLGVGGSYLGTRAVYDIVRPDYTKSHEDQIELVFLGYTMNERHIKSVLHYLKDKNFAVNVISRSGETLEIKVAYNLLMQMMKEKYTTHRELSKRLLVTTTAGSSLHAITKHAGVKDGPVFFEIPSNIGGRFSTLTSVGLLPLGIADINIKDLLEGAFAAYEELLYPVPQNPAYLYACSRAALYSWAGMNIELGVFFEPSMDYFMKWWRSIFAESEGKKSWGLFPAIALYTSELHSLGQWIQQGDSEITFETFHIVRQKGSLKLEGAYLSEEENFLTEKPVADMEYSVLRGVLDAHQDRIIQDGKKEHVVPVPHIVFEWSDYSEKTIGYALYYLQKSAAMYCLLCDINPFNQPGVEDYKTAAMEYIKEGKMYEATKDVILDYKPPVVNLELPSEEELQEQQMIEEARDEEALVTLDETEDSESFEDDFEEEKKLTWREKRALKKQEKELAKAEQEQAEYDEEGYDEDGYVEDGYDEETSSYASSKSSSRMLEERSDAENYDPSVIVMADERKRMSEKEDSKSVAVVSDLKRIKVGVEEIGEIKITIRPKQRKRMIREDEPTLETETKKTPKKATPKKAAPKKESAKKETAKKATPAKKTTAKKATPKKESAKKETVKKATPAKKTTTKKAAPKKATPKKAVPAKKASTTKTPAKKAPVKKTETNKKVTEPQVKKTAPKKLVTANKPVAKNATKTSTKATSSKPSSKSPTSKKGKRKVITVASRQPSKGYARSSSKKAFTDIK